MGIQPLGDNGWNQKLLEQIEKDVSETLIDQWKKKGSGHCQVEASTTED